MKKLNSRGFSHWILPIVVILIIGAVGGYIYLRNSSAATTALSGSQCMLLGRVYSSPTCTDRCITGATPINAPVYNYCPGAVSPSVSSTTCASKGRKWAPGGAGCTRRWQQTNLKGAIQCSNSTATYVVSSSIDYCTGSTSVSSGSGGVIVGSMAPVGGSYRGSQNCELFIEWVLLNHVSGFTHIGSQGGKYYAGELRSHYGWKNVRAPHAVVSMPSSRAAGHVALVDKVSSDGSIYVEEVNFGDYYHSGRHISASTAAGYSYAYSGSNWH